MLPDWLADVILKTSSEYSSGGSDYSATSLIKPPLLYALEEKHRPEDRPEDLIPSFIGTSIHNQLELKLQGNSRYIVEKRYFRDIYVPDAPGKKTFTISGQIDLYDTLIKELSDHKTCKSYKVMKGETDDWQKQLNVGRWLFDKENIPVESMKINAFVLDWSIGAAERDRRYPQHQFVSIPIDIWEYEDTERYIRSAILEKEYAKIGQIRECNDSERWASGGEWAVMKKGRKSAIRLLENKPSKKQISDLGGEWVERRPVTYRRCQNYCKVSDVCPVYKGD